MVFGDIDLQAHRDWLEPACERAGLVALFPLWGEPRDALARELRRARRAGARRVRGHALAGRVVLRRATTTRPSSRACPRGVCPCGEDGEFHTFVTGGPGFAAPLRVVDGAQRRVASQPPFAPTEFVFQPLVAGDAAMTRFVMVWGTSSGAGKSWLATALCRSAARRGTARARRSRRRT